MSAIVLPTDSQNNVTPGTLEDPVLNVTADGALSYSIPIWVPPGRLGIEPSLAFSYHSRSGNGTLGIGWSLSGLPRISLGARTVNDDGAADHVRFDGSDPYYLDGERLVCVSGSHGEAGAEYRTKRDRFCKIILRRVDVDLKGTSLGPAWFEVFCKDGTILTFGDIGRTGNNAILHGNAVRYGTIPWPSNNASTDQPTDEDVSVYKEALNATTTHEVDVRYAWPISSLRDRSGNALYIFFRDAQSLYADSVGYEIVPVRIEYTESVSMGLPATRSVQFSWEKRPDIRYTWVTGLKLGASLRLSAIQCFGPNPLNIELLRRYSLAYRNDSVSSRSLLASITESDQFGVSKPPMIFDWETGASTFTQVDTGVVDVKSTSSGRAELPGRLRTADFNSDGREDILFIPNSDLDHYYILSSDRSAATGFAPALNTNVVTPQSDQGGRPYLFNTSIGDGVDIITLDDSAPPGTPGYPTYRAYRAGIDYSGFSGPAGVLSVTKGPNIFSANGFVEGIVEVADLDGDGLPDLLHGDLTGALPNWSVRFNQGGNLNFANEIEVGLFDSDHYFVQLYGDQCTSILTSDGALDPNGTDPRHGFIDIRRRGEVAVVSTGTTLLFKDQGYIFADLAGAGQLSAFSLGYAPVIEPSVSENIGGCFGPPIWTALNLPSPPSSYTPLVRVMDYDQDGAAELLVRTRSALQQGDEILVLKWNGTDFTSVPLAFSSTLVHPSEFELFEVFDSNGNGLDDVIMYSAGMLRTFIRDGKRADMMTTVTDGYGAQTSITYLPISDGSIHKPTSGFGYPQSAIASKVWVVSNISRNDGLGGFNNVAYTYEGAVEDVTGEGFLGFVKRTVTHKETGQRIEETYDLSMVTVGQSRVYPFLGMVHLELLTVPVGTGERVVSRTANFGVHTNSGHLPYFVFIQSSNEQTTDSDQNVVQSVKVRTSSQACDLYGNVTQSSESFGDGNGSGFSQDFSNDANTWLIGLPTFISEFSNAPGVPAKYRRRAFSYDLHGRLVLEITEPGMKVAGNYLPLPPQSDGVQTLVGMRT
jgi:hypothetical protein